MMTYEEYQQAICSNIERSRDTRVQFSLERKAIEEETRERTEAAREQCRKYCKEVNELMAQRIHQRAEYWKQRRADLFLEHAKVIEQWREEHGINCPPPHVELPAGERPNEGGTEQ